MSTRSGPTSTFLHLLYVPLGALLGILAATGCDTGPTTISNDASVEAEPASKGDRSLDPSAALPDFYPLDMNDHWEYAERSHLSVFDDEGNVIEDFDIPSTFTREITGTEILFGREYVLETETGTQESPFTPEPSTWTYWYRYREDKSGLYEADVAITDPPGGSPVTSATPGSLSKFGLALPLANVPADHRSAFQDALRRLEERRARAQAALGRLMLASQSGTSHGGRGESANKPGGGLLDNEITRLDYPLHAGATWDIRNEPGLVFHARVEKHETLDLPAGRFGAWRIRILIQVGVADPSDDILVWYGPSGFMKSFYHIESEATDPSGNVVGTVVSEEAVDLTGLQLTGQPVRHDRGGESLSW